VTLPSKTLINTTQPTELHSIIQRVNALLHNAVLRNASDIHLEPYGTLYRIRYRQDGILYVITEEPLEVAIRLITRLKILSNLDISERRLPQDGRFQWNVTHTKIIDFRINTCPLMHGEKVVLRLLDSTRFSLHVDALGFTPSQQDCFLKCIHRAQGLILATGPTGSGKTMTLYTALQQLNTPSRNCSSVEDPVEMYLPGINQVQINPKAGLHFANVLRAFLRQDPDVIMIGEIRDLETAEIAMKAAQTGHLVLSTLHTNSAIDTLTRLMQMGIPPFQIVHAISLIIAQRLVRKLCMHCKKREGEHMIAVGCTECTGGYYERIALFEIINMTPHIAKQIIQNPYDLNTLTTENEFIPLYQQGRIAVKNGLTTLEEIQRVLG